MKLYCYLCPDSFELLAAGAAFSFFFSNSKNIFKRSMREWGESRCNKCPNIRVVSAAVVVFVIMHWKIQLKWVGHTFQKYEVYAWLNFPLKLFNFCHIFWNTNACPVLMYIFHFMLNKLPRNEKWKNLLGYWPKSSGLEDVL